MCSFLPLLLIRVGAPLDHPQFANHLAMFKIIVPSKKSACSCCLLVLADDSELFLHSSKTFRLMNKRQRWLQDVTLVYSLQYINTDHASVTGLLHRQTQTNTRRWITTWSFWIDSACFCYSRITSSLCMQQHLSRVSNTVTFFFFSKSFDPLSGCCRKPCIEKPRWSSSWGFRTDSGKDGDWGQRLPRIWGKQPPWSQEPRKTLNLKFLNILLKHDPGFAVFILLNVTLAL